MKTSREHKRLIAVGRSLHGKKNGVLGAWWFDCAQFIWKHANRKRRKLKETERKDDASR